MGRLIYTGIQSLDGYINDAKGSFDWAAPDHEVHAFVNDLERGSGTYLYGRRMYEVMSAWETMDEPEPVMRDFATLWRSAEKIVFSTTLTEVASERTRIESRFDAEAIERLKDAAPTDISIGGPTLARAAIAANLVDEFRLIIVPVIVGAGTPFLPAGIRENLVLNDERRINETVYLSYTR